MTRRYSDDEYFFPRSKPKPVKNGMAAKTKRGAIGETWWSKRWVEVLESFDIGARLSRGRSYARRGQVMSIDIAPGVVKARVQGSMPQPYKITIQLTVLSDGEWDRVIDAMAGRAVFAARLLAGEMPQDIETAIQDARASLFPTRSSDLKTDCSCPDWSNPCKHIAAVCYILAEQFDTDPFLIFKLRGRAKEEIIAARRWRRRSSSRNSRPSRRPRPSRCRWTSHSGSVAPAWGISRCISERQRRAPSSNKLARRRSKRAASGWRRCWRARMSARRRTPAGPPGPPESRPGAAPSRQSASGEDDRA